MLVYVGVKKLYPSEMLSFSVFIFTVSDYGGTYVRIDGVCPSVYRAGFRERIIIHFQVISLSLGRNKGSTHIVVIPRFLSTSLPRLRYRISYKTLNKQKKSLKKRSLNLSFPGYIPFQVPIYAFICCERKSVFWSQSLI